MDAILLLLAVVGFTISVVLLVLVIAFLNDVPKYLERIASTLRLNNEILYKFLENHIDK